MNNACRFAKYNRPFVHFSTDMFCSKLQSNSHSYRLTYSHQQNESYFVRHFCWKQSFRVKNAECSCHSISVHYARIESPFHTAISRVIYHWADIMASRCSHIGITEAGHGLPTDVVKPSDWVACGRPLRDWGVNPLYYYPTAGAHVHNDFALTARNKLSRRHNCEWPGSRLRFRSSWLPEML